MINVSVSRLSNHGVWPLLMNFQHCLMMMIVCLLFLTGKKFLLNPTIFVIKKRHAYLPAHCAAMKNTAFNNETLPAAIIQIVTAGLSCPPDTCWTAIARVAMLRPWLNPMCITEGAVLFHGKTVPQTMNRNNRVARSSASTSVQNDRDRSSIFPSWKNILTCSETGLLFPTRVTRSLRASGCQI